MEMNIQDFIFHLSVIIANMTHICKAYPNGIPPEVWTGKVTHDNPYKQDNNIVYKKSL